VSIAWRPQTKLSGGCQQKPVLLLRLWPRRGRDSLCGTLSPVKFSQAIVLLCQWRGAAPLLDEVSRFYRVQLHRHSEAVVYLYQRGIRSWATIELMQIGYAPGGCLRGWLTQLGHPLPTLHQAGLVADTTHLCGASSFRSKAIFMAVAFRLRHRRTVSCRALRVACMPGRKSDSIRK
jgi:hypothetical protein